MNVFLVVWCRWELRVGPAVVFDMREVTVVLLIHFDDVRFLFAVDDFAARGSKRTPLFVKCVFDKFTGLLPGQRGCDRLFSSCKFSRFFRFCRYWVKRF